MKNEIKPGLLCYLRNIEDPPENNGRIVEVLRFDAFDPEIGENVWWVQPQGTIMAYQCIEMFGQTWQFKRPYGGQCLCKQSTLVPINDPDLETDDVTSKDLTEVLQ